MEIKLENVTKTLKRTTILSGIDLQLVSGRVYGFEGYNGSGKTMIMRMIAGLLRPTQGQVLLDGKVLGREIDFPPSIGLLLEQPGFLPHCTGAENLALIASMKGKVDSEAIRTAICRVGLDPDDRRHYRKYSLGMKQRLGIACAVFERPELILLDEPTNALDPEGVELVSDIILQERDRGAFVVIASHEKERLASLSDVIYTVEYGKITGSRGKNV